MEFAASARRFIRLILSLLVLAAPGAVLAAYPERPITLVVPFSAGGPTDALARVLTEYLAREIGEKVLVDNRGGAGGRVATELAAAAAPDGYTVFFSTTGTMAINPALYPAMTLDPIKAFDAVVPVASSWNVLVVLPSFPATSLKELIALAKEKPGALTFGSAGNGSTNHLSGELLKLTAGINILHVPYKGSAGAIVDLLGGRLSMMFDTIPTQVQNVQSGRVKALAQTGTTRSTALPNVPTAIEAGLPGFDVTTFFGFMTPRGTPVEVRERLRKATLAILAQDEVRQKLLALGAVPIPGTSEEFEKLILAEKIKWTRLVKESGATVD